jgi:hypothetical protein
LAPGEYKGKVVVESTTAAPKMREVAVTLKILPQEGRKEGNSLTTDVDALAFEVRQGSVQSDSKVIQARGTGVSRVNVTARARGSWLRISPTTAPLPTSVSVSVNAEGLPAGVYQGEVIIAADGAAGTSRHVPISLRVREPERIISQVPPPADPPKKQPDPVPPPVDPPKKQPDPVPPVKPTGTYGGIKFGQITWVGGLGPGQELTITKDGVASGGGKANGRIFPGDVGISVEVPTQGITVNSAPAPADGFSRLVVVNQSASPISVIQIRWRVLE